MKSTDLIEIFLYITTLTIVVFPLGQYIGKVLGGERHFLSRALGPLEKVINAACGVSSQEEMNWKRYGISLAFFNFAGFFLLFLLQILQASLALNPDHLTNVPLDLALNTAISFVTNTNWQAYSGETTMSHLTQMTGLGVQNFLSAATGLAVFAALARGLSRKSTHDIGNFWVDLIRSVLYIFVPLSLVFASLLMSQGIVQSFAATLNAMGIEGSTQGLPLGPVASQVAIKQLGTNGGGFFGVNSTHPFENPTPLSNFLQLIGIMLIPASLPFAFGRMVKNVRHGRTVFLVMFAIFLLSLFGACLAESMTNPALGQIVFYEGKEVRFSLGSSVLWSTATSLSSNGSVNAMLSSMSPLAGGLAMLNIMLGEVVFGGVGSGMYGMALFVILAVFIAGLMVGRTPEYLGKKIEAAEIKLAVIGLVTPSIVILLFSAISCVTEFGLSSLGNRGPHGLSEILYAFSSAAGNNGSAFGSLNANTTFYNSMLGLAMLVGRYGVLFPVLAIAGGLAAKKVTPPSTGTFPTEGALFGSLLAVTIFVLGALTFFPALCLGPIIEHFLMLAGRNI